MTIVSFYSVTVSAGPVSALFGSWVSCDARGMAPRESAASRHCGEISYGEKSFAGALNA
jgi:hypothetical protein